MRAKIDSLAVYVRTAIIKLLFKTGVFTQEIHYIHGPETLPPPLSRDEEQVIFLRLEQNDVEAKQILITHNLRLVVYIARKFESTGYGVEDLISIGTIGLIKSVNTFCPSRGIKLATYASRCIENEILMYLRKCQPLKNEVSIEEPINTDWDGNELLLSDILGSEEDSISYELEQREERQLVRDAVCNLAPRERELIELRYGMRTGKEMTQKEVADLLGISQSYISRLEKRILSSLRESLAGRI